MIINQLTSSSAGNCTIVSNGETTIMIDAGIALKKVIELAGKDLKLDALFITHEHSNHIKSAGVIARKFIAPVFIPELSFKEREELFNDCAVSFITGGSETVIKSLKITAFSTKHDSKASVGFVITDINTGLRYAHITDTGTVTPMIKQAAKDCDAYFVEADYDYNMLMANPDYDETLKTRISSPLGHLSNQQTLDYIREYTDMNKSQFIILGHLSRKNNSEEIILKEISDRFSPEESEKFHISFDQLILEIK